MEDIRKMDLYDFDCHVRVCLGHDDAISKMALDNAQLAAGMSLKKQFSGVMGGGTKQVVNKQFDPTIGDFV